MTNQVLTSTTERGTELNIFVEVSFPSGGYHVSALEFDDDADIVAEYDGVLFLGYESVEEAAASYRYDIEIGNLVNQLTAGV